MAVSDDDVRHVASLARLDISEDEVSSLGRELDAILTYIERLNELDTDDVPPTSHVLVLTNVFRDDIVIPSLSQDEALANAPQRAMGHFRVPKVIV